MKGHNHFSMCSCTSSPRQLVCICLMPWKGYLTRTSSRPCTWLLERKGMPWSLLTWKQLSCWDLAMLLCQLIACVAPTLALVWLQRLHLRPHKVYPMRTFIWLWWWLKTKYQLSKSIGPTKTRQNQAKRNPKPNKQQTSSWMIRSISRVLQISLEL